VHVVNPGTLDAASLIPAVAAELDI